MEIKELDKPNREGEFKGMLNIKFTGKPDIWISENNLLLAINYFFKEKCDTVFIPIP